MPIVIIDKLTCYDNSVVKNCRRMRCYLAEIVTRVSDMQVLHLQHPVVGVPEGGPEPVVSRVRGLAHCQEVRLAWVCLGVPYPCNLGQRIKIDGNILQPYCLLPLKEHPAVQHDIVPIPHLHHSIIESLKICFEDSLL